MLPTEPKKVINLKNTFRIIGIGLFAVIIYNSNITEIWNHLKTVKIIHILIVLLLNLPMMFIKSLRWGSILRIQKVKLSVHNIFLIYYSSAFLGVISPGNIGEFSKAFYLKNEAGTSLSKGFISVLTDRIFDLYVLIILGTFGIWHLNMLGRSSIAAFILILLLLLPPLLMANKDIAGKCIWLLYNKFILKKFKNKLGNTFKTFYDEASEVINSKLFITVLLTCVGTLIFFIQCYLLVLSMGMTISFITITIFMAISRLISLIPISISGIGTRDAILIYLFSLISLNPEAAVTYSFLVLFSLFIFNGLIGAFAWWIKPLDISWNTATA